MAIALLCLCGNSSWADVTVDANYPGGNIIVGQITEGVVDLQQDLRDTKRWWFYWNFRVRGSEGRTLKFRFTNRNVIGNRGPAVSLDEGRTWSWLGMEAVEGASFSYAFAPDAKTVRFAFSLPYQETDLKRFLAQHDGNRYLAIRELCKTRKGRSVERIHIGKLDGHPTFRVLITCRHHACESTASYVVEGMMAALLAETEDGKWFREKAEVLVVPFMDKDGVEDGDQGKGREPWDHCRDYSGKSLYSSVGALRQFVPKWSDGRLKVAFDLHSPYIREQAIYLVGSSHRKIWNEQRIFSLLLEARPDLALPFNSSDNMPFGQGWNIPQSYTEGKSFFQWADELEGIRLSSAFEIPYANVGKKTLTPDDARAFGASLIPTLRAYVEQ
ncbi:MAG: M14 family zinc carboxypeptidase [Verrucomicrobia bacterium]|nr:M14 family zinc carboxypeptidase [Verrucomicrobiota bacterium]